MDENSKITTSKRRKHDNALESEGELPRPPSKPFPRFVQIEATDPARKLGQLSPFVIEKVVQSTIGTPKSIKKLGSGGLLIEVERATQSENLLGLKTFFQIPCVSKPHATLNSSRGIIRCPDLKGVSTEEIQGELKSQLVSEVRRISVKRNGATIETNTLVLTFATPFLPKSIKVGYLHVKVDIYVPNPLQCYNCYVFGHNEKRCSSPQCCRNCGDDIDAPGHPPTSDQCKKPSRCRNCRGDHMATSRQCDKWKIEREVLNMKYTQSLSFPDARRLVEERRSQLQSATFSSIVKSASKEVKHQGTQCDLCPLPPIEKFSSTTNTQTQSSTQTPDVSHNTANATQTKNVNQTTKTNSSVGSTNKPIKPPPGGSRGRGKPPPGQTAPTSPKQRVVLSDRPPKGSNDPIRSYNRYEALQKDSEFDINMQQVMEMEDQDMPQSPARKPQITKITPPN